MAIDSARSMKKILRFLFGLFINVCILFILVKAFTYSFDFAYQVFATKAADPANNRKVAIQITPDEALLDVADALKKAEVIDNKYAFILKVRLGGYAGDIKPGTYQLAPSNTNKEIIDTITGAPDDTDGSGDTDASSGSDSGNTGVEDTQTPDTGSDNSEEETTTE